MWKSALGFWTVFQIVWNHWYSLYLQISICEKQEDLSLFLDCTRSLFMWHRLECLQKNSKSSVELFTRNTLYMEQSVFDQQIQWIGDTFFSLTYKNPRPRFVLELMVICVRGLIQPSTDARLSKSGSLKKKTKDASGFSSRIWSGPIWNVLNSGYNTIAHNAEESRSNPTLAAVFRQGI